MGSLAIPLLALFFVILITVVSILIGLAIVFASKGNRDRRERKELAHREQLGIALAEGNSVQIAVKIKKSLRGRYRNQTSLLAVIGPSLEIRLKTRIAIDAQAGQHHAGQDEWHEIQRQLRKQLSHRKPERRALLSY